MGASLTSPCMGAPGDSTSGQGPRAVIVPGVSMTGEHREESDVWAMGTSGGNAGGEYISFQQRLQMHRSAVCCSCDSDNPGHSDGRKGQESTHRHIISTGNSHPEAKCRMDDEREEAFDGTGNSNINCQRWSTAGFVGGPIMSQPVEIGEPDSWEPTVQPLRGRESWEQALGGLPAAVADVSQPMRWDRFDDDNTIVREARVRRSGDPNVAEEGVDEYAVVREATTSTTVSREATASPDFCRPLSAHLGRYSSTRVLPDDVEVTSQKLGEGRAGGVYLASRRLSGAPCAVKTLRKEAVGFSMLKEFRNEVDIFISLDHPYIARLEGVYENDSEVHLVMEHLGAGDLLSALRESPQGFAEARAAETTRQMLLAVAYLHRLRVAHRDLKPVHFMYASAGGCVKLIDFSLSQRLGAAQSKFETRAGTREYMAPELQYGGSCEKADIYSLGIIVHRLLCGIMAPVTSGVVQSPAELLQALPQSEGGKFVAWLLNEDPARRPSALEALRHPWLSAEFPEVPLSPEPALLRRLKRFACEDCGLRRTALEVAARLVCVRGNASNELGAQFLALDRDKGGTASLEDFEAYARRCRSKLREPMVRDIFRGLAEADDGKITYSLFLAAALAPSDLDEGAAKAVFAHLDEDGDSAITSRDVSAVLTGRPRPEAALSADEEGIGVVSFTAMLLKDGSLFPDSA